MSANSGHAKKVLGFLVCAPAFTKRNLTSMGLVGAFFFVYVLAGGKIDTKLPAAPRTSAFGGLDAGDAGVLVPSGDDKSSAQQVLGETPTDERDAREQAGHMKGRVFTYDDVDKSYEEPLDQEGLIEERKLKKEGREERTLKRYEKRKVDPLDAIEERLRKPSR